MNLFSDFSLPLVAGSQTAVLLDFVLKGSAILAVVGGGALVLRRASSATRSFLWSFAFVSLLLLPALSLVLPSWSVSVPEALLAPAAGAPAARAGDGGAVPLASAARERAGSAPLAPRPASGDTPRAEAALSALSFGWGGLLVVWAVGAAALALRLVLGLFAARRLSAGARSVDDPAWHEMLAAECRRLQLRHPVELSVSPAISVPMTLGILRPRLLLPAESSEWSSERRRVVLLHELAHIERRDCLLHVLAQIALALHWLNPLAWLGVHRMRLERERACDDRVIAVGEPPADYATHLLGIAQGLCGRRSEPVLSLAMARRSQLEGRLLAILDPGQRRGRTGRLARLLTAAVLVAVVLPLAALNPVSSALAGDDAEPKDDDRRVVVIRKSTAAEDEEKTPDVEGLLAALKSGEMNVRIDAIRALGEARDGRAFAPLVDTLADASWEVRKEAALALGQLGDRRAVEPLIAGLKDDNWQVRHLAALALGMLGDRRAVEPLMALSTDPSPDVREQAATALGALRSDRSVDTLVDQLRDPDSQVRERAVSALAATGDRRVVPAVVGMLDDGDWQVRERAAEALGILGDPQALAPLVKALSDDRWEVRHLAALALGRIGDAEAVTPLSAALRDRTWQVRHAAVEALGDLGDARAADAVRAVLEDSSPRVREAAATALERLAP